MKNVLGLVYGKLFIHLLVWPLPRLCRGMMSKIEHKPLWFIYSCRLSSRGWRWILVWPFDSSQRHKARRKNRVYLLESCQHPSSTFFVYYPKADPQLARVRSCIPFRNVNIIFQPTRLDCMSSIRCLDIHTIIFVALEVLSLVLLSGSV